MQQIINFILRYKNFLLYVFLLGISLAFTIRSQSYHRSMFLNSANWLTGNIYRTTSNITTYFDLGEENKKLVEENKRLRTLLFNQEKEPPAPLDSTDLNYKVISGQVIKNSYSLPHNYITKIGRASCRERVQISEGSEAVKKNTRQDKGRP